MSGQMCWLPTLGSNEEKLLHLRTAPNQPWQYYKVCSQAVPDYNVPEDSKGLATFHKLIKEGWTLIPTKLAQTPLFLQEKKSA